MPNGKKQGKGKPKKPKQTQSDIINTRDDGWSQVPRGIADCHKVALSYGTYVNFAPTSGALSNQQYSGNSLFDPDVSGVGSQPYWFDQWAAMYGKYRVVKSRIELELVNTGSVHVDVCLVPTVGSPTDTSIYNISEWKYARKVPLAINTGGPSVRNVTMTMKTEKVFGLSKTQMFDEDGYAADYTTNPAFRWYWQVFAQTVGGLTTTPAVTIGVRVTYYAIMFAPRFTGDSVSLDRRPLGVGPYSGRVAREVPGSRKAGRCTAQISSSALTTAGSGTGLPLIPSAVYTDESLAPATGVACRTCAMCLQQA